IPSTYQRAGRANPGNQGMDSSVTPSARLCANIFTRRAADARDRGRRINRGEVHDEAAGTPPSQGWKTFLRNHAAGIASIDLFVVRTISFKLLYGLVILRHARRRLVSVSATSKPTAVRVARRVA